MAGKTNNGHWFLLQARQHLAEQSLKVFNLVNALTLKVHQLQTEHNLRSSPVTAAPIKHGIGLQVPLGVVLGAVEQQLLIRD
jgi:hypothetical protein